MNSFEISCVFDDETVSIESNLLMKENFEAVRDTIQFPEYIHPTDVQLYSNFLNTGYLKRNWLQAVKILLVADFLQQYQLCEILINEIICPLINLTNLRSLITLVQSISSESFQRILKNVQGVISQDLEAFSDLFDQFADDVLINLILSSTDSIKEQLLLAYLKKFQLKSFLELLDLQLLKVQETNLDPDLEFSWRVDLNSIEDKGESATFTINSCNLCLGLNKELEEFQVYIKADRRIPALFRALTVYQGEFQSFFYYPGTKYLPKTSQKTTTISVKLVLANEPFLFELLKKAVNEVLNSGDLKGISENTISIVIEYLKEHLEPSELVEILAEWAEANPDKMLSEAFESFDWRSQDSGFWASTFDKFPVFSNLPQLSSLFIKADRRKSKFMESNEMMVEEVINIDEYPCQPLSPTGNPFILDISEIKTPAIKSLFVPKPSYRTHSANHSISGFESTIKYSEIRQKFSTPSKYSLNEKHRALELIKELKRKLLNQPLHKHNKSFSMSSYFN